MRHILKPALRRLWRGPSTVQIGLDPDRAVVLAGCDEEVVEMLDVLAGNRELASRRSTTPSPRRGQLVDMLRRAGLLDDIHASTAPVPGLSRIQRDRLAPDLAALSLTSGAADGGLGLLRRRRAATVAVHGAGRVGGCLATLLAAAGVGTIEVVDAGRCRPADCVPGGLRLAHLGRSRREAVGELVTGFAAAVAPALRPPQVAVLTDTASADPRVRRRLTDARVPHLVATVRETTGVVGAFVLPGRSACLQCQDLHRTDRDPGWPVLAAQLAATARPLVEACDAVLATAVACWAAREVLGFVDESARPATVNGSLELSATDWRWRRRGWSPHPKCGCVDGGVG